MIMLLLKAGIAWIFYFAGDLVSKIMDTDYTAFLYPLYNKLMTISVYIQGEDNQYGPWGPVEKRND